ncbi:MAG: prepilin-type N-terminal cleavage/methylation domain-containing protein [Finegoldia magna]|uniref:prepilin-type N-terminal cleavage/methylation domain-containing protein n=1 Tax=Finegoldia TaxID=150022 RepID=UPI00288C2251|nr:prepilin-type N-terminal cleavage/methylation domain-containing protein [Finegoldia magna]MDU2897383.1 prepilin-type N-terminal cleavage/methylation domain-containing protein [Finegoldia magna]MDU5369086.1 prepilin-type N-terminal cleavage/methylation domain-containing protein [Finegoldia magna]MDU5443323.1 prepilin-type N-terminal cleavage/methylation domain-containing protein [Finegoldia magna]MDU7385487.1 prepilin-type N-terminal cleavage/methylation domain-containing protein [Finegoldia 
MFSKLKMKAKAFSLIEVMVSLFIISVVIMICVFKYDFKTDVASRKEINTLVSDLKSARSVAMNAGRSIQFRFDTNSYYFYDSNKMKNLFERDLKNGTLRLNKGGENTIDFGNIGANISKSSAATHFPTIYYETKNKTYRINCYIATGRVDVDETKK